MGGGGRMALRNHPKCSWACVVEANISKKATAKHGLNPRKCAAFRSIGMFKLNHHRHLDPILMGH
jgi:hypothetical protein